MPEASQSLRDLSSSILQGRLTILTGQVNCGKSAFLATLVSFLKQEFPQVRVGGILCRGVFRAGAKVGYELEDLHSGERSLFAIRSGILDEKDAGVPENEVPLLLGGTKAEQLRAKPSERVGQWLIFLEVLEKGREAIREAVRERYDLVVVDEFGKLELQGKGFRPAIDELAHAGTASLLVVRKEILADVQRLYEPYVTKVIPVSPSNSA